MRATRRVAGISGVAAVGLYLVLAAVSGHLSPFARGPLLDTGPLVVKYRWVDPPPGLQHGNQQPLSRVQHVPLGAGGNQAAVVETPDLQCTLVLLPGAIPAAAGQTEAIVTVKPLAPSGFGAPPDNRTIGGNVYSIQAQYEPSGQPVTSLTSQSRVLLVYPLTTVGAQHVLLRSQDRGTWTVLPSQDSLAASQLTGTTTTFGYFAAGGTGGASTGAAPVPPSGGGHPLVLWILLGLAAAVAIAVAALGLASRRNARRQSPTPRRRPPPRRPERW